MNDPIFGITGTSISSTHPTYSAVATFLDGALPPHAILISYIHPMGQIRTPECEKIDNELRAFFPGDVEIETQKDTYSEDYMIWVTADDVVHPIRITVDEYLYEDWKTNVRQAVELLTAQTASGDNPAL